MVSSEEGPFGISMVVWDEVMKALPMVVLVLVVLILAVGWSL